MVLLWEAVLLSSDSCSYRSVCRGSEGKLNLRESNQNSSSAHSNLQQSHFQSNLQATLMMSSHMYHRIRQKKKV